MGQKVQFMVLVDESTRDRMDALRIVDRESRARIGEEMILAGLRQAERSRTLRLERLHRVAAAVGKSWQEYVAGFAERYARRYGPTLEELETEPALGLPEHATQA